MWGKPGHLCFGLITQKALDLFWWMISHVNTILICFPNYITYLKIDLQEEENGHIWKFKIFQCPSSDVGSPIFVNITKSNGCSSVSAGPKSWYQYVFFKLYHLLNILPSERKQIAVIVKIYSYARRSLLLLLLLSRRAWSTVATFWWLY